MEKRHFLCIFVIVFYTMLCSESIELRAGVYDNPPKIYQEETGEVVGFWGELTNYIAKEADWELTWVHGSWKECLQRLESGEIDVMVDVAFSEERQEKFLFQNETTLLSWTTLYTGKGKELQSILDLNNEKIGALRGSINLDGPDGLREITRKFELQSEIIEFDDYESVFQALINGEIDAAISNRYFGYRFEQEYELSRTPLVFQPAQLYYAFSKKSEKSGYFIDKFDTYIRELKSDSASEYYHLIDKYLGMTEKVEILPLWLKYLLGIIIVFATASFIFVWVLKYRINQKTQELEHNNEELEELYKKTEKIAKQWEATFNSITDVIMLIDTDYKIREINQAGCKLAGKPRLAILGQSCYKIFHNSPDQPDFCPCKRAFSSCGMEEEEIFESGRYYLATAWPILDNNNEVTGFSHAIHDITEKKLAEQKLDEYHNNLENLIKDRTAELETTNNKLMRANNQLQEASKLKSQFLANMSHELRSPLNSIIGFTGILLQGISGELNSEQTKQLEMVYESSRHLLGLINDILDLSKIEAGRIKIINEKFNTLSLLDMVVKMVSPLVKDKGLSLKTSTSGNLPEKFISDRNRIKQVLINLLSNAVKFTEKGTITLTCEYESSNRNLLYSVEDTGIGINSKDLVTIFDEFTQVESRKHSKPEGTGLGLAISSRMVRLMGGELKVESEYGKGSKFYFNIPSTDKSQPLPREEEYVFDKSKRLILTVDDEEQSQEILKTYLNKAGYEVIQAYNEKQTLKLAEKYLPFAITLDIIIPGRDGWDILNSLKKNTVTSDIPVICISTLDNRDMGLSLGAIEYLVKPIDCNDLINELKRLENQFNINRILIVDDNEKDRNLISNYLNRYEQYILRTADGGKNCLLEVEKEIPDLIILDLMMPEMDGFEVISKLKEDDKAKNIPIIIVSGKILEKGEMEYLNSMIEGIIRKGVTKKEKILDGIVDMIKRIEKNKNEKQK